MVGYNMPNQRGTGIMENLLKPFTVQKYGQEMHARSFDPKHFLTGYNYVGPKTELMLREKLHDDIPLNDLDQFAKTHDYAYLREKEEYDRDNDKPKHIKRIWESDDQFIRNARQSNDDPIMGKIAANLIEKKEQLEKSGLMDTKKFSGFGDPVARLRKLSRKYYRHQEGPNKKEPQNKLQHGGFLPAGALAVLLPAAGTLLGKILVDAYTSIKHKITGKGYKMNHTNNADKIEFMKKLIKQI